MTEYYKKNPLKMILPIIFEIIFLLLQNLVMQGAVGTVLPAKNDSDFMFCLQSYQIMGAQWLSGRVLASRLRASRFELHRLHCVVVLEQDTFILA